MKTRTSTNVVIQRGEDVILVVLTDVTEGFAASVTMDITSELPQYYRCIIASDEAMLDIDAEALCEKYSHGQYEHAEIKDPLHASTTQAIYEEIKCGTLKIEDIDRIVPCKMLCKIVKRRILRHLHDGSAESRELYSANTVRTVQPAKLSSRKNPAGREESEIEKPKSELPVKPPRSLDSWVKLFFSNSITLIFVIIGMAFACAFFYAVVLAPHLKGGEGGLTSPLIADSDVPEEPMKLIWIGADGYASLLLERTSDNLQIEAKSGIHFGAPVGEYLLTASFDDGTFRQYYHTVRESRNRMRILKKIPSNPFDGQLRASESTRWSSPITVGEFEAVMPKSRSFEFLRRTGKKIGDPSSPVEITYGDAVIFAERVGMRLPSKDELETTQIEPGLTLWSHTTIEAIENKGKFVRSSEGPLPARTVRSFANLVLVQPSR